jgi:tetratricopeptide (TPR) repeat protein
MIFLKRCAATLFFSVLLFQGSTFAADAESCLALDPFRKSDDTLIACEKAVKQKDKDAAHMARLHAQLGEALYWLQRFDLAIEAFDSALNLDKSLIETRIQRGWALLRVDEGQRAFQDFSDSLQEKPDSGRAIFAIGYMYDVAGQPEQALAAYKQAIEVSPKYYLARSNLAKMYRDDRNEKNLAIAEYNTLLSFGEVELNNVQFFAAPYYFPTKDFYAHVLMDRALALAMSNRLDEAIVDLNWLMERYSDAHAPKEVMAGIFVDQDKFVEAAEVGLEGSVSCRKNLPYFACENVEATLVFSLLRIGKNKEAAEIGVQVVANGRNQNLVDKSSYYAGLAMARLGNIAEARRLISAPVANNPKYRSLLITQLRQEGFYEGDNKDEMNDKIVNALEACLLDIDCLKRT